VAHGRPARLSLWLTGRGGGFASPARRGFFKRMADINTFPMGGARLHAAASGSEHMIKLVKGYAELTS